MNDLQVMIIEDDPDVRLGYEQALKLAGMRVRAVDSAEKAQRLLGGDFEGVIVSDIRLPGQDGLSFMRNVLARDPDQPVILVTGHGDISLAVTAMKDGAYDFIEKPFLPQHLIEVLRRALEKRQLTLEVRHLKRQLGSQGGLQQRIIGRSPAIEALRNLILDVSATSADLLINGETGTGKELVARCVHDFSGRKGNFVALNCGGLPETLFESEIFGHEAGAFSGATKRRIGKIEHSAGGTLFLDEIESMPVAMQIKLLRVLQERTIERLGSNQVIPVDCRVIAATKVDLAQLSEQGQFRSDLYYRLNVVSLDLPNLRSRREDIPQLFDHFVGLAAQRHGRPVPEVDANQLHELMAYAWPGNVRELRNTAERHALGIRAMPGQGVADKAVPLTEAVEAFERTLIAEELRRNQGNLTRTASALSIAKTTLFDKVRKYGLEYRP